jgi:PAS domain-containing protein
MAADEKDPSFAAYCLALESGEEPEAVRRSLYDRSGQFRTYEMHRSLMRDADGNPCGMRMLCVDVTETRKELEDARRRNAKLESVIESMCTAVLVTDAVGFIRSANPAAEELLGWQTSELRGVSIEEGFPVLAYLGGGRSELTFSMALEGPPAARSSHRTRDIADSRQGDGHNDRRGSRAAQAGSAVTPGKNHAMGGSTGRVARAAKSYFFVLLPWLRKRPSSSSLNSRTSLKSR